MKICESKFAITIIWRMAAYQLKDGNVVPYNLPQRKDRQTTVNVQRKPPMNHLETLLDLGFSKLRAEKALAATGYENPKVAADWLLSHVNDLTLDEKHDREYIMYLCPVGELRGQLEDIHSQTLFHCGWNKGHDFLPHVTLCSFFQVADSQVPMLGQVFDSLMKNLKSFTSHPTNIDLHLVKQDAFIGLDMTDQQEVFFKQLSQQFETIMQSNNITIYPQKKKMHVSIAYGFQPNQAKTLGNIASDLFDEDASASWDLRLYSRDPRFGRDEVYKVLYPHTARNSDELDLIIGDFIYVDENEKKSSPDGWYLGTSWLTGCVGLFPGIYSVRVPITDTWTLLKSHTLVGNNLQNDKVNGTHSGYENMPEYAKVKKKKSPKELLIIRHGERTDFVFGKFWYQKCFDHTGYIRHNLNMPEKLPPRQWGPNDWRDDCPVTVQGQYQAKLTGESLKQAGVIIDHVYVSPAYRCVETAAALLKGYGKEMKMRIEPGLFEWMGWYKKYFPKWFLPKDLKKFGFNIDTDYTCIIPKEKLNINESIENLYSRGFHVSREILKKHQQDGGNVLVVAHAGSLDTNVRQLCGGEPCNYSAFHLKLVEIPFLAVARCQENEARKEWEVVQPPIMPFTHAGNKHYEWEMFKVNHST